MFYINRCDTTKEGKVKVKACALKNISKQKTNLRTRTMFQAYLTDRGLLSCYTRSSLQIDKKDRELHGKCVRDKTRG